MERFIKSAAKKMVYVLAACVIVVACFVVSGWLLAPYFESHRVDVEKIASSYLKKPVTIENVSLSWDQYQPVIRLRNVTILDEQTSKPALQIKKVSVFISLWESIRNFKFMPGGALISGTELNVHQKATGEFAVQGFPAIGGEQPFQEETSIRDIVGALFSQSRIILRNIEVSYTDKVGIKREITLYNLSMKNSGSEHTIVGKAVLHQDIPTEVTLALNMYGTAENYEKIKADAYLYVTGFSLSQWMKGLTWQNWRIDQGLGSAKIWATWDENTLQRIQSVFQLYDLKLYSATDKSTHIIPRLSGDVGWKQNGNEQIIAADDLLINLPGHLWPATSFYILANKNTDGSFTPKAINVGYVDLNDVRTFLFSSPVTISEDIKKVLIGTQFNGVLQHASVVFNGNWDDWQNTSLNAEFSHLQVIPWQNYPGVKNLSGVVKWDGVKGDVTLKSEGLVFADSAVFGGPIRLDQVTGDVAIQKQENVWKFATTNLQLLNKDISANIEGSFALPTNSEMETDLKANFSLNQVNHIVRYLPVKIFSTTLVKWLQDALLAGKVESGTAELSGKLKDFPFENDNGVFKITGIVNNVDLRFAPDWPKLTQIGGKILFSGNQMSVDVNQGWMMDVPVTNAHAEIPYLGAAKPNILYVKSSQIKSDMPTTLAFIHASPLEKNIGRMFKGMKMTGPVALDLALTVPLADPSKTTVEGDLNLDYVDLDLVPWDLSVNKLKGKVHFTEATTSSEPLVGQLFDKPVTIQLETVGSSVRANITNNLNISDIENWLKLPLAKVATGDANLKWTLDLAFDAPISIKLATNLEGVKLDLPDQYAKTKNEAREFTADITVQENKPLQAKLSYNKMISAGLIFDRKDQKFSLSGANLQLGGGDPALPEGDGIYITGTIDSMNWDKIKSYLDDSKSKKSALEGYKLKEINVMIKQLDVFNQHLTSALIEVIPSAQMYEINLNSPQIKGNIKVPVEFNRSATISGDFDYLTLTGTKEKQTIALDFKTLPALSVFAKDVSYNNMQFGQVTIKTRALNDGQTIESMHIASKNVDLRASGTWMAAGKGYKTTMKGVVDSNHVSDFLNALGMDVHNFVASNGHANFNLSWNDAFYSPDVASLNGSFSIDLGPGRIVDVGESGGAKMDLGKILSLFSLQTIPRRLSLDFSDVFQKGYSFDFLRGDFNLTDGNVFTNNLRIEGPVAKIAINGRIGLNKKDVNFMMDVTPLVTSSLPVAAGLVTVNPLVGLGALAVNTVIGSQISKAITYRYDVKGPWVNPTWQQVNSAPVQR